MIDPVQSIRVAVTLAERFGTIISQGNAAYGEAAVAELELRIGEAQQMYPEIWRHLDDACGVLTAKGVDVGAYDALRRADLVELGVTDVDASQDVDFLALRHGRLQNRQMKAAAFNTAGHKRAVAACNALMAAMPEVDWKALAREEAAVVAKAGSLRGRSNMWWLVGAGALVVVGALALLSLGGAHETASEKREREEREQGRIDLERIDREVAAEEAAHANDRPSCGQNTRSYLEHKIVEKFGLVHDEDWVSACAGGRFRIDGKIQNALVVAVTGRDKGELVTLRGFADPETYKPVSMARYPVQIDAVEVRDLDGDGADEVVWKTARGTVTSTVRDGIFIDRRPLEGPGGAK